jgi:crotonobetainyl-CoA:carnitine CoA-transferase CaiB-like acyl-CoA transferase
LLRGTHGTEEIILQTERELTEKQNLLEKVRLLDLAEGKAAFCAKLLADLGAEVIKLERPGGDLSRNMGPFLGDSAHPERSLSFFYHNTNKKGITLNLEDPTGREIFLKLVPRVDVIVESFPPGTLDDLRLGWKILSKVNPRLILASITGFGQNGPRSRFKSCDLVASAYGGQMYVSGSPSTPPLRPAGEQSCYAASLHAAIGILLALRKRARDGRGAHIDLSTQEAVTSTLEHVLVRYFYEKTIARRQGALYWNGSFGIFPCQDGHILLTPLQNWETLVEWMASEGMAEDLQEEKWQEEAYRRQHIDHILRVLQRWTQTQSVGKLFEQGQLLRFPWAPLHSPADVGHDQQLEARGFFLDRPHPETGQAIKSPGLPYRFGSASSGPWKPAPRIGEDNREIYQKELGLTAEEVQRLAFLKVI